MCAARKDLTGMQFGEWTVLEHAENRMWKCKCSCGNIKNVLDYSLTSGRSTSCRHPKITNKNMIDDENKTLEIGKKYGLYIGKKFGEWEVVGDITPKYKVPCRCSCGKEREVNFYTLRDGRSTGCGHTMNQDRVIDLTNQVFGNLTVIRYIGDHLWECKCSCGNIVSKHRNNLLDGRATSCGHGTNKEPLDILGRRFGKLTAIKYAGNKSWICRCDCGNEKVILGANLRNGSTISCGCVLYVPSYEELIKLINKFTLNNSRKPSITDLANEANVGYSVMLYHIHKNNLAYSDLLDTRYASQGEREVYNYVNSIYDGEVKHNVKNIISPLELDIYIPDKKLAIEFNGDYWHSNTNKHSTYHQEKSITCAKSGVQLIHIFEYQWNNVETREKIKQLLRLRLCDKGIKRYFAKDTVVKQIGLSKAKEFCIKYHLNDWVNSSVNLGLYNKENELLGVMTFGKPRFDSWAEWELLRMVFKSDVVVVGGAAKLISYFNNNFKPQSIVSYCDFSKFIGETYNKLGFEFKGLTKANYVWSDGCGDVIKRYNTTKDKLVKLGYGTESDTEDSIMKSLGYMKIFDCGNLKFIIDNNK